MSLDANDILRVDGPDALRGAFDSALSQTAQVNKPPLPANNSVLQWGEIDASLLEGARGEIPVFPVHIFPAEQGGQHWTPIRGQS